MGIIFSGERSFWELTVQRKFYTEEVDIIPIRNSFYLSLLSFADYVLHVKMFRGNCPGEIFRGFEIVWGIFQQCGRIFCGMNSPRDNFAGESLQRGIFLGNNFPLGGGERQRNFFTDGRYFCSDWKND